MYFLPLLGVIGKLPHNSDYTFPSYVVLGSAGVQKTTLVIQFSSRYVSGVLFLVYCSPCRFIFSFTVDVFVYFSRCFLINTSMRPVRVLRKPFLIGLKRLVSVGLNSVA